MKKGVIFDQDGILFDTEKLYGLCWHKAAEQMGFTVPDGFHKAVAGTSGKGMMEVIRHWIPECADPPGYWDLCARLCMEEQCRNLPEKPGLHEILHLFHENGLKIAVASSSRRVQVERNLHSSGIRPYFDAIVTGEDVKSGKPDPAIFLKAAQALNLPPEDCYVFEDSFNGVRAGHAAGCRTVMIPDVLPPTDEIRALCEVYPDFFAVIEALKAGNL